MSNLNTDLGVSIKARVDTSQARKDIEAFTNDTNKNRSRKIILKTDLDLNKISQQLETGLKNNFIKKIDDSMERVSTKIQKGLTGIFKGQEIENLTKVTEKFKSNLGEVQERVTVLTEGGKPLTSSIQTIQKGIEDVNTSTQSFYKVINNVQTKITEVTKTITDTNGEEQKIVERTQEWVDANGKLYKSIDVLDENGNKLKNTVTSVSDNLKILTTETHNWTNSSGEVNKWTTTIDGAGNRITTKVKEAVTAVGELTRTTKTAINGRNVGQAKTEIIEFAEATTTSVNTVRGTIQDLGKSYEGMITTTEKVSTNGEYLRTVVSKYTNEMGQAVEKTEQFNKAGDHVATTMRKISEATPAKNTETRTWIDKNGVKTVEQYLNGVLQLTTRTREYANQNKELVKETTQLEGAERKLISTHTERSRNIQKETEELNKEVDAVSRLRNALISTTTTTSKGKTTQFGTYDGKEYNALITTIERVDAANKKVIETTYEFKNAQGQLVRQTRVTDEQGKKLAEDTIQISNAQKKATDSTNRYNTSTKQATVETKTFGQALSDAIARLARYYIASLPIQAFRKSITEAITTVKEFDNALIEFRKVSDLAGESLTRYVAKLAEMGEVTGSTMQAMVEASTEFRKSGFSDEDSAKLASIAEKYRNIADEEISAGESASFIIAQMKAFNIEAGQAEHIIDAVNEVANNFSVSSADLATNLGNMSAIMAINNVSMEEQIGMLTGVTEITRNASSASRGLVMVSSRLTQVLDDTSSTGKKLTKIYNDLGIELKDENGQLRSHYDILGDLAGQWNTLSENQQKYIALTSAGARQQQNFVALMENWNQVAKATNTAYQSIGSAQRENEKVMESIAKKVEILKSQFQQLVIGKGGLQDFAKKLLDIGIALLKFANSDIGKVIIKTTAFMATIGLLTKGFNKLIAFIPILAKTLSTTALSLNKVSGAMSTNVVSTNSYAASLMGLTTSEVITTTATENLTVAIKAFTVALMENPFTLILTLIAAVAASMYALKQAYEENTELIDESKEKILSLKNEINDLRAEIQKEAVVSTEEKNKLAYLEKRLELTKQLLEKTEKLNKSHPKKDTVGKSQKEVAEEVGEYYKSDPRAAQMLENGNREEVLKNAAIIKQQTGIDVAREAKYQEQIKLQKEEAEARKTSIEVQKTELSSYINLNNEIANWNDSSKKGLELLDEKYNESQTYLNSLTAERDKLGALRDTYTKNQEEYTKLSNKKAWGIKLTEEEEDKLNRLEKSKKALSYADAERLDILEKNVGAYEKSSDSISTYQGAIDEFGEESEEADNIIKEFAKDLGISEEALISNANALGLSIDAYYEYAMAIKASDEELDSLQSAYDTLSSAVDEYNESQSLSLDTVQALLNLQPQYLTALIDENGQLSLNEKSIINIAKAMIEERKQLVMSIAYSRLKALEAGEVASAADSQANSVYGSSDALRDESNALSENTVQQYANAIARDDRKKQANAAHIVNEMKKELAIIDKIGDSLTSLGSKGASSGRQRAGGSKAATNALKDENKAVNDLKSQYDKVITFITGRIDKQIKAVQKAKDEAVKAVEAEIKAREKQKDKALDAIEQQINALEKEKKAREKYWDDQIDVLKKANDERKDALELQEKLDALERAKNTKVKVYKEGQGFVYDVDQTAVAEAQKALDEYLSEKAYEDELERLNALKDAEVDNYDKRLDALNEYKDKVQESYEKQIEALEAHKQALEEQYDAQIEYYQNFKEQFEEMVKAYEDKQTELLASQLTGINFENNNWMTRLDNLAKFVSEYNRLQEQLNTGNTNVTNNATMTSGSPYSPSSTKTGKTVSGNTMTPQEREQAARVQHQKVVVNKHANGVGSISDNEIAVVGENPNKEIVIGSKINNGELMSLNKGTGVVNAKSSNTLAGLLNQVGQFGSSGFGSGNGTLNSNINNDSLTINGVTIQGANIKDPETFVNGLLNLKAEALQRAYRHR